MLLGAGVLVVRKNERAAAFARRSVLGKALAKTVCLDLCLATRQQSGSEARRCGYMYKTALRRCEVQRLQSAGR